MARESTNSRLIARLREISRGTSSPLGFGRATAKTTRAMILVARLPKNDVALAKAALGAGADALVLQVCSEEKDCQDFGSFAEEKPNVEAIVNAAGDRPVGLTLGAAGELSSADVKEVVALGVDFVVSHPHRTTVDLLAVEELGHVARLGKDTSSGPLRGLNELNVDAMELATTRPENSLDGLTVHDLALYRQTLDGIRRPVILAPNWSVQPSDLKFFRDLGVEAVVLGPKILSGDRDEIAARVGEYSQQIAKLEPPVGRARALDGRQVVLPRLKSQAQPEEDDDGDDDDDV